MEFVCRYPFLSIAHIPESFLRDSQGNVMQKIPHKPIRFRNGFFKSNNERVVEFLLHHGRYGSYFSATCDAEYLTSGDYKKDLVDDAGQPINVGGISAKELTTEMQKNLSTPEIQTGSIPSAPSRSEMINYGPADQIAQVKALEAKEWETSG